MLCFAGIFISPGFHKLNMVLKYAEALGRALKFCIQPKRFLPVFVLDLVFLSVAMLFIMGNPSVFLMLFLYLAVNPASMASMIGYIVIMALVLCVWGLLRLWVMGALVYQSYKPKDFRKSFDVSFRRFIPLLLSVVIVAIISMVLGLGYISIYLPWISPIGTVLTVLVSLAFFFIYQGVIVKGFGVFKTLKDSWSIFRANKREFKVSKNPLFAAWLILVVFSGLVIGSSRVAMSPALAFTTWILISALITFLLYSRVFSVWLVNTIFSGIITLIFALPFILFMFLGAAQAGMQIGTAQWMASAIVSLLSNTWVLYGLLSVGLIGVAVSTAFSMKLVTEFYMQIKKKRFGLI